MTLEQQSNLGPGAGENPVVTTTAPVQHEDDPVTHHPTLRGDELKEREEEPGTSNP